MTAQENFEEMAVARKPCPFYGMLGVTGALVAQNGKACGYLYGRYIVCSMEAPNWDTCERFNRLENIRTVTQIMDTFKVIPGNMLLKNWFTQVMGRPYP